MSDTTVGLRRFSVYIGGEWVSMAACAILEPADTTPLNEALAILLGTSPQPCPECGRYDCECNTADPHGDLSVFANEDLPY
jgi:hypothetical protein